MVVGNVFHTRTRPFNESEMTKRVPSVQADLGEDRVDALIPPLFAVPETKSGCPSTRSAAWPLAVGIEFQIKTRLLVESQITKCVPSVATARGDLRVVEVVPDPLVVMLVCPRTIVAVPPIVVAVGVGNINTRLCV